MMPYVSHKANVTQEVKSESYNLEKIKEDNKEIELVPCDKCGRKFLPDRLPVHSRGCKGKK